MKKIQIVLTLIIATILFCNININKINAAELNNSQKEFIIKIKDYAIDNYKKHKILPSLTISQAILESGFGESTLSKKANNLFGIKAYSDWNGDVYSINTREYINGSYVYIKAKFKSYSSLKDSIADHSTLLLTDKYKSVRLANNYITACNEIHKCGYATAPNYSKVLIDIIEDYKLYEYDNLAKKSLSPSYSTNPSNNKNTSYIYKKLLIDTNNLLNTLNAAFINCIKH